MIISIDSFRGMQPRVDPHLLESNLASLAINCNLLNGSLKPWRASVLDDTLVQTSLIKTIYQYLSAYWFEFSADVDILPGPIANDTVYKRYFTGIGIPKKTNEAEATTGVAPYPINFYPIGVPQPAHAAIATLGAGGSGDPRALAYQWTIVTSWGEEGAPAPVSNILSPIPGQTVDLSNMTIVWQASEDYDVGNWVVPTVLADHVYKCVDAGQSGATEPTWGTAVDADTTDNGVEWRAYKKEILFGAGATKRLYRILTGDTFGQYHYVGAIAMGTTIYSDNKTDTEVVGGTILPSNGWYAPPDTMIGLTTIGRFMAGFVGKDLYFSEPNYPHAWPLGYSFPLDYPIVALGSIGNTLVAGTEQNPYIIQGSHPDIMTPVRLPDSHPCVAKRGLVAFPSGIAFPSNDGLYFVSGATGRVITQQFYTRKDWQALHPQTWHAERHDGRYFAFYDDGAGDKGGVIIDLQGEVTMLDFFATALYVDPKTDTLYYNLGE